MAFPVRVHQIAIRFQNNAEAHELILDPAEIQTMIVHWRDVRPTGVNPRVVPVLERPTELAGVPGVMLVQAAEPSRRVAAVPGMVCWHDRTCIWHCPDMQGGFVLTDVAFTYANQDGTWRTLLNPAWADQIVFRNFAAPDPDYRPPRREEHVLPVSELIPGERGVLEHVQVEYAASTAGEIVWHDPTCIWHRPE